ncbi:MAG: cupin domain-containing protein [Firmicutes bacterium]|nr:cupin domain-containing protein [Bacillota bacterium]
MNKNYRSDYGNMPFVIDIKKATDANDTYRTALWTGKHLQVTLMSINPGEDIGLEVHPDTDQFLKIEQGVGIAMMGACRNSMFYQQNVYEDSAVFVPAGTWHNIVNIGKNPLKIYSVYAPPHHPWGTVHATKAIAELEGD